MSAIADEAHQEEAEEEFGELVKFTGAGFGAALLLGALLDFLGFQLNPVGQWVVRTLSGEGESIFEGVFALRQRLRGATRSMAEAYGWGKLLGMTVPWFIDWGSRRLGVDVYGVQGFYIPYFYGLSDQIGANISGLVFLRRTEGSWSTATSEYLRHPVMLAGLLVILIVPVGLLLARVLGFSPTTQTYRPLKPLPQISAGFPPLWAGERSGFQAKEVKTDVQSLSKEREQ